MRDDSNKTEDLPPGRISDPAPIRLLRRQAVAPVLIGLFVVLAFSADLIWPSRKSYFATYTYGFKNFTVLHPVPADSFFTPGGGGQELYSPLYMSLLRAVYAVIPHRLAAMRVLSVICGALILLVIYRTAVRLFSPATAAVFLFLLATSPIYVESMRAFGYQSLSHLAVALTIFLATKSSLSAAAGAAVTVAATLTLYVTARPVAAFPILFFALDLGKRWKNLLLYLAVFTFAITAAGLFEGKPLSYPWGYLTSPEEQAGLWPVVEGKVRTDYLKEHLGRNAALAAGYLLNLNRRPFADRESSSRLFNPLYTPFFILGLVAVWFQKREGAKTILLTLFLFFLLPLASREIQPRRVLMGIYPLYLLIVLGMGFIYRLLVRRSRVLGFLSLAGLAAAGLWDLNEFVFRVSRPRLGYGRAELKAAAAFIRSEWKEVSHIRYFKEIDELIMGNPYFATRPEPDFDVANIFAEEAADPMRRLTAFARDVGENTIYLYTDPPLRVGRVSLERVDRYFGDLVERGPVPGVPGLYYIKAELSRADPNLLPGVD